MYSPFLKKSFQNLCSPWSHFHEKLNGVCLQVGDDISPNRNVQWLKYVKAYEREGHLTCLSFNQE